MTLVVHTHITETQVAEAVRNHHLNFALLLENLRGDEPGTISAQDQIRALALRDPAAARRLADLLAQAARSGAEEGMRRQYRFDPLQSGALGPVSARRT